MHVDIRAVWSTIQPMGSSLLRQRNCQITSELSMPRTNFLIINHTDVDCQVVTRPGRLTFKLSFCLKCSHIILECQWSTIPFTSVGPVESVVSPMTLKMRSLIARRRISCKPLLHLRQQFLPLLNLLHWRPPGSRNDRRESIPVLMRTVRRYTSNSAV